MVSSIVLFQIYIFFGGAQQVCFDCSTCLRSPDTSRVRSKMIYASSKDRFKRELDGIQVELQATDPTEMGLDVFRSRSN